MAKENARIETILSYLPERAYLAMRFSQLHLKILTISSAGENNMIGNQRQGPLGSLTARLLDVTHRSNGD